MADGSLPSLRDRILDAWASGDKSSVISKWADMTPGDVWYVVRRARDRGDLRAIRHPSGVGMRWTPEQTASLIALWNEGLSCSQIAARLGNGLTRNAVIGKSHRLGLPTRKHVIRRMVVKLRPVERTKSDLGREASFSWKRRRKAAKLRTGPHPLFAWKGEPVPPTPVEEVTLPPSHLETITLMERQPFQCSWVIGPVNGGETLMCGAKVHTGSWCKFHSEKGTSRQIRAMRRRWAQYPA